MVFVQVAMLVCQRVLENMNPTESRKFGHPPFVDSAWDLRGQSQGCGKGHVTPGDVKRFVRSSPWNEFTSKKGSSPSEMVGLTWFKYV